MELDYEQYKLVTEALHERRIFLQTAPYLSHMLPIMLPIYKYVHILDSCVPSAEPPSDIGRYPTTGWAVRCTTCSPERRTWSPPT